MILLQVINKSLVFCHHYHWYLQLNLVPYSPNCLSHILELLYQPQPGLRKTHTVEESVFTAT